MTILTCRAPRLSRFLLASMLLAPGIAGAAETPSLQALWALVQKQQAEIERLNTALDETRSELASAQAAGRANEEKLTITTDYLDQISQGGEPASSGKHRTSIGGYGELHYNDVNADGDGDFQRIDFHRLVTFIGHEFTDRIRFFSEVEIEHALVEDTADGSGSGEVEVEQAYIEFDLSDGYAARTGLFLLPVGILNETHEPTTFYGVERNDVESIIIPATWWEAGAGLGGHFANGLSWEFAAHSGLAIPTTGSDAFRVRSGRQKVANANADHPAFTGRVRFTGVPGLELAATLQYQEDASQIPDDGLDSGTLVSTHAIWNWQRFQLRALWSQWNFDGDLVELADADRQTGWYVEPSLRLGRSDNDWGIYGRYEDVRGARVQDRFNQWEAGVNYWPTENVVFKLDYRERELDGDADGDFSAVDLGLGYQF
jgi:hypothetical protein